MQRFWDDPRWLLAACVLAMSVAVAAGWLGMRMERRLRAWRERRATQSMHARARRGERDAASLLRAHGFVVSDIQPTARWRWQVDGVVQESEIRCDYLVQREGCTWVAEVKTGPKLSLPTHGPTRRQLMEYVLAYACEGALLVDMHRREIHEVRFDLPPVTSWPPRATGWGAWLRSLGLRGMIWALAIAGTVYAFRILAL